MADLNIDRFRPAHVPAPILDLFVCQDCASTTWGAEDTLLDVGVVLVNHSPGCPEWEHPADDPQVAALLQPAEPDEHTIRL